MKLTLIFVVTLIVSAPASAQWLKQPDPAVPRGSDGKANLTAPAPRGPDGRTDLSGVWLPDPDPNGKPEGVEHEVFPRYFVDITADHKPGEVSMQPWAVALFNERLQSDGKIDPVTHCLPSGVPAAGTVPLPYKIVQTPQLILILYEENTIFRQILDGRRLSADPQPRWMGYSTGRWDGDVLVVDTVGFNDRTWLDRLGHPHSDALHIVERFRRRDTGHLEVEVTVDDPKTYARPITYTQRHTLIPDEDLLEYFCLENEIDIKRFR